MAPMNRRRQYLCVVVVLSGLLAGAFWLAQLWERSPIRYESFARIQVGMSKVEVVQLLGCPPGNHSTGQVHVKGKLLDGSSAYLPVVLQDFEEAADAGEVMCIWLGDHGAITVTFDLLADSVCQKDYAEGRRLPGMWWLAIERFLGRDVPWVAPE